MKRILKFLYTAVTLILVFSLSACVVSITCISHIDKDENDRCDNCKQSIPVSKTNVKSIAIKTQPTKSYYAMNETLDITGGVITVTYNDGTPSADFPFSAEGVVVSAPSMVSEGQKLVAITYGGKTVTYTIEVGVAKFSVSFDLGYAGGPAVPPQSIIINGKATEPPQPERTGFDFGGWYTSSALVTVFDFSIVTISENTTIYAKWFPKYTVTYSANYSGGTDLTYSTVNGKASDVVPATRPTFSFAGWYSEPACIYIFNFDTTITKDTTLYAKWVADSVTMFTVTINHNYGNEPITSTTSVPEGSKMPIPASPSRASVSVKGHEASGFTFAGWFTDPDCTNAYNFDTVVTKDMTLYAKWTGTYVFEAEHVSLVDRATGQPLKGMGASGGAEGPNMVDSPSPGTEGINASNGYYVTYLYAMGLALHFVISSDRDVTDATLIFRISAENSPYALSSYLNEGTTAAGTLYSQYLIMLNDVAIQYETIEVRDVTGHSATGGKRPFSDFTIAVNLSLKKGMNVFSFITANSHGMGGTMSGTAPVIDCIKVTTYASLSWIPITGNEFGQ